MRVTAVPIAGYYNFAHPYKVVSKPGLPDFREEAWPRYVALWGSYLHPDCKNRNIGKEFRCMLAEGNWRSMTGAFFMVQSQSDKVQLMAHDGVPRPPGNDPQKFDASIKKYINEWRANETAGVHAAGNGIQTGYFYSDCWFHTKISHTKGPFIRTSGAEKRKLSYMDATKLWYDQVGTSLFEDDVGGPLFSGDCGTGVQAGAPPLFRSSS